MKTTNEVTLPMQGLAAYLRCEAGGVFVGHPSHDALIQWAKEVESATDQGKRQPLTEGDAKDADNEAAAKAIYESWSDGDLYAPWVDGGNSIMQDRAREKARRAAIEAATLAERERCAKEAEHWQTISATPGHACGQYIAAAIRLPLPPTTTPRGNPND